MDKRQQSALNVKSFSVEDQTATFVITSDSVDSHKEVVEPAGLDMEQYMKSGLLIMDHWPSVNNIVGKPLEKMTFLDGETTKIAVKYKFWIDELEDGNAVKERNKTLFNGIQNGYISDVSIGFASYQRKRKKKGEKMYTHHTDTKLIEVSLVVGGSNPDANLMKTKSAQSTDSAEKQFWETLDELDMAIKSQESEKKKEDEKVRLIEREAEKPETKSIDLPLVMAVAAEKHAQQKMFRKSYSRFIKMVARATGMDMTYDIEADLKSAIDEVDLIIKERDNLKELHFGEPEVAVKSGQTLDVQSLLINGAEKNFGGLILNIKTKDE